LKDLFKKNIYRCKIVDTGNDYKILNQWAEKTIDHEFKGVVGFTTHDFEMIKRKYFRGLSSLRMMEQKTGVLPMSFVMKRGHFLIKAYNENIHRLRDAGITEFLINLPKRKNEKINDFGPQILSMEELEICFLVCLSPLMLALIAFIIEVLWNHLKNGSVGRVKIVREVLTEKQKQNEIKIKKDLKIKVKLSDFAFFNRFKEFSLNKKLSDCFNKKRTEIKLPKIIQVKPKITEGCQTVFGSPKNNENRTEQLSNISNSLDLHEPLRN
jgi:hypothetical protein